MSDKLIIIDNGQITRPAPVAAPKPRVERTWAIGFVGGYVTHKIIVTRRGDEVISMVAKCGQGKGKAVQLVDHPISSCMRCR